MAADIGLADKQLSPEKVHTQDLSSTAATPRAMAWQLGWLRKAVGSVGDGWSMFGPDQSLLWATERASEQIRCAKLLSSKCSMIKSMDAFRTSILPASPTKLANMPSTHLSLGSLFIYVQRPTSGIMCQSMPDGRKTVFIIVHLYNSPQCTARCTPSVCTR